MSLVSDVFNKLVAEVKEILPKYNHLPDGLEIDKNSVLDLNNGFSVTCGDATAGPAQYGCQVQIFERNYTISLTNIYTNRTDPDSRDSYELALMEDLFSVTKGILAKPSLGGLISGIDYVQDTGPQYLDDDKQQFLFADLVFLVKYEEKLQ